MILATNIWFGSPFAAELTAGTDALCRNFTGQPVRRYFVDCAKASSLENNINSFSLYRDALCNIRSILADACSDQVVLLGGGCAAAVPVVSYLHSRYPELRVIWVDAHGDMNLPSTSTSKYIHGMALGILLDRPAYRLFFEDDWPLTPDKVALCGQKNLERYEVEAIHAQGITQLSLFGDLSDTLRQFAGHDNRLPVYVHVDLDVLHPADFINPKCAVQQGLHLSQLASLFATIHRHMRVVGYSLAENFETDDVKVSSICHAFQKMNIF